MNREPSVFPVAPATVFPADSKPGVPDGLCDQRGAPMSTRPEEVIWNLGVALAQAEQERDAAEAARDEVFAVIERQHVQSSDQQVNEELHAARAEVVALRTALEACKYAGNMRVRSIAEAALGSTTEPEETRAALVEAGESLDLTGRVLDFEIVAEPEENEK